MSSGVAPQGDPIGVRLLLAARSEAELDHGYDELVDAYWEVARQAPAYREWLKRSGTPEAARVLREPGTAGTRVMPERVLTTDGTGTGEPYGDSVGPGL